jgi:uncharacterized short protein YbdD (DUF466 family)
MEPDFNLTSTQIQAHVREMDASMRKYRNLKTSNPSEYRKKVSEENDLLYNRFPTIFEMHIEGKLDDTFFEMLKLKRKIEKGEMTEHDASVLIGQKLFDRYVGPVVNKTPAPAPVKSYAEYYNESTKHTEEGKNNN